MVKHRLRIGVTALLTVMVCVPVLALGPDDFTRQKLPPQTESGMYDKRDLQSGPGPEEPLPKVPTKPVLIEPGAGSSHEALGTPSASGLSGAISVSGGLGSGAFDPMVRAESAMRKVIRRLD